MRSKRRKDQQLIKKLKFQKILADKPKNSLNVKKLFIGMEYRLEFNDSRSKYFELALELARSFDFFEWKKEGKTIRYRVITSADSITNICELIKIVSCWMGSEFYIDGKEINIALAPKIIRCISGQVGDGYEIRAAESYKKETNSSIVLAEMEKELELLIEQIESAVHP